MSKQSSPNTALYIIISIVLIAIVGFMMIQYSGGSTATTSTTAGSNIEIRDGIQYITIDAKGGYKPRNTTAK